MEHYVAATWKALGGTYAKFTDYGHTDTLMNFADSTQQIYLGMNSFSDARSEYWKKRHARRRAKAPT